MPKEIKRLHFIIMNFIIVKNTCVSHNNPFAGTSEWGDTDTFYYHKI